MEPAEGTEEAGEEGREVGEEEEEGAGSWREAASMESERASCSLRRRREWRRDSIWVTVSWVRLTGLEADSGQTNWE